MSNPSSDPHAAPPPQPKGSLSESEIDAVLADLCAYQQRRVLEHARRLNPRLTADDVMNPIDVPELSASAAWNYEDGLLAGYRAAHAALRAALYR